MTHPKMADAIDVAESRTRFAVVAPLSNGRIESDGADHEPRSVHARRIDAIHRAVELVNVEGVRYALMFDRLSPEDAPSVVRFRRGQYQSPSLGFQVSEPESLTRSEVAAIKVAWRLMP